LPIVIHSGAYISVTPHMRDFRGPLQKCPTKSLDGLSSKTEVLVMGKVTSEVQDLYGVERTITTMAYYVQTANIRLFSPKVYYDEQNGGSYHMERGMTRLTLGDGTTLTFPYQTGSKLAMMLTSSHFNNSTTKVGLTFEDTNMLANLTVADEVNQNLTSEKNELLLWHWKLGHADMQVFQMMIRTPQETSPHEQILFPKVKTSSSNPQWWISMMMNREHRILHKLMYRINDDHARLPPLQSRICKSTPMVECIKTNM
jgi:hypothetical protein